MNWIQEAGRQPSKKHLALAQKLAKPDSQDCIVIAMAMRPKGVTQTEIVRLFGHPHRNIIRKLVQQKAVKRVYLPDASRARRVRLIKR